MKKKPLVIAGISLAVIGLGFLAYKLIQRAKYNVVEGENTTFLVTKETPENVEEVDVEENSVGAEPMWEDNTMELPKLSQKEQLAEFERISGLGDF